MGSGKTTLGKKVASSIGFEFIDMDNIVTEKEGMSINKIFETKGEKYFRNTETEVLKSLSDLENTIISTGGGTPCFNKNIDYMNSSGITIYLKLPPDIIFSRVKKSRNKRPLLKDKTDEEVREFIKRKLEEREPFYSKSGYVVNAFNPQVADITTLLFETC